ncbi:uncharacterized protein BDR25DRAFT_214666, partial [Lindgomyces ingoldianus]
VALNADIATCAFIVAFTSLFGGKTTSEIAKKTGISARMINSINARVIEPGLNSNNLPVKIRYQCQ